MTKTAKPTPMLEQYWHLKTEQPQALLLFRLGDFYELFEEDAIVAAPILDVQLTSRDGRVPMCGVPHHAVNQYVQRLLQSGYTVAIAEQMEDPQMSRGLVDRQIVRVVTPGTVIPEDESGSPQLAVLWRSHDHWAMVMAQLSTGKIHVVEGGLRSKHIQQLKNLWEVWKPDEYLSNWDWETGVSSHRVPVDPYVVRLDRRALEQMVSERMGASSLRRWGLEDRPVVQEALGVLWRYLEATQKRAAAHLVDVVVHSLNGEMAMGARAISQLDVLDGPYSLYARLNATCTPMGARQLKEWLQHPLVDYTGIAERSATVAFWVSHAVERDQLREALKTMGDLSRRVARVVLDIGKPRDVLGIHDALSVVPTVLDLVTRSGHWMPDPEIDFEALSLLRDRIGVIERTPVPARWDDTPLIQRGTDDHVDRHHLLLENQRQALLALEDEERHRSGIKSLKVGYHRTFGYYLEVLRSQVALVPTDWQRRQSTTHSERFSSEPLQMLERAIHSAEQDLRSEENQWAQNLQAWVKEAAAQLTRCGHWLAEVDVLVALAEVAVRSRWALPQFHEKIEGMEMRDIRHPVLEGLLPEYVASDLAVSGVESTLIITGPNMGGKSTFMRAVAQNVILAQMGAFVAAREYRAPLFDAIHTRVGADDDLARGQSTFMVEMEEVAAILATATAQSLIILDELGRGTSTYDGLAIAQAVIEQLASADGPMTLFATHYHELTSLAQSQPRVINLTVEVDERSSGLVFTHRVVPGSASKSYGLEVAKLAGIPPSVIRRAEYHLRSLEPGHRGVPGAAEIIPEQLTFYDGQSTVRDLMEALRGLEPDAISPREAWAWVDEWKRRLDDDAKGGKR